MVLAVTFFLVMGSLLSSHPFVKITTPSFLKEVMSSGKKFSECSLHFLSFAKCSRRSDAIEEFVSFSHVIVYAAFFC